MEPQRRIVFTRHAVNRWRQRLGTKFSLKLGQQYVREAREAYKSERRKRSNGLTLRRRLATASDRKAYLVHDGRGLMFVVKHEAFVTTVKTLWKLRKRA